MTPQDFLSTNPVKYKDWFGKGDSHKDYHDVVGNGVPPDEVLQSGTMLCLIWKDRVVAVGYDGGEYHVCFEFKR